MDVETLDKQAYDIVCNWYKAIGFNPVLKGIDYSLIIRFYLWDKVGRALRVEHGIDFNEVNFYTTKPHSRSHDLTWQLESSINFNYDDAFKTVLFFQARRPPPSPPRL